MSPLKRAAFYVSPLREQRICPGETVEGTDSTIMLLPVTKLIMNTAKVLG